MEINPQSVILPDAPLSNHTIRVDIQWTPANLPGWILYYDLDCDQNYHSSTTSTTGTNTYSLTSPGYENYQIQFRFGSLDPNQPTITGTYQLYFDEQLIRSASFQAQKATYSSYAYFNTHYQSPVLTDYTFSIYTSEICPGRYEDIYLATSRNCNATAEINTEQDSITLTIETGKEFVSFYKNNQKKDTVTFMYHELGSVYLRQDSIYTGTAPINVNIKSDWTGIIKYQQLVINPQEQFQIRVPDQPIIVFSGGVGGLKIETYSSSICPPYISENLRYTALIKKGSSRGLLYDYDTGQSGDTLTNLTPQEDGEKYLDFITEGEILNEEDTVLIKIFANDENIDTTEAVIIIYPNNIDVQIIPPVISQGDTARVVLKKRGENGLEDFPIDQLFDVEITQGIDYGLILDSLSNDTLSSFTDIPQGFKIIAKDSTGIDSTRIRIKVSTEESGFPVARMLRNDTRTNKKEIVDDNKNQKSDDEIITPDWIIPGPILLEGYGDVVVKQDECDNIKKCAGYITIIPKITTENEPVFFDGTDYTFVKKDPCELGSWGGHFTLPHKEFVKNLLVSDVCYDNEQNLLQFYIIDSIKIVTLWGYCQRPEEYTLIDNISEVSSDYLCPDNKFGTPSRFITALWGKYFGKDIPLYMPKELVYEEEMIHFHQFKGIINKDYWQNEFEAIFLNKMKYKCKDFTKIDEVNSKLKNEVISDFIAVLSRYMGNNRSFWEEEMRTIILSKYDEWESKAYEEMRKRNCQ